MHPTHADPLDRRFLLGGLAGAAGISALAAVSRAGPLNPPGGAVTSTGKTLTDVEPRTALSAANTPGDANATFIISQPGSYYLTGAPGYPSTGTAGDIIRVTAGSGPVVIDLNGFTIPPCNYGVRLPSGATGDVTIRNGAINGCNSAVASQGALSLPGRLVVADVRFTSCVSNIVSASPVEVRRCTINTASNFGSPVGISAGPRSLIDSCLVATPGVNNILVGAQSQVRDCITSGATGYSIDAGGGSVVDSCTLTSGTTGVRIGQVSGGAGGIVRNCTLSGFTLCGINAMGATVEGNTIIIPSGGGGTPRGIESQTNCDIVGNRIDGSGSGGVGIRLYSGRNTVRQNAVSGFSATNGIGISIVPTAGTGNSANKIVDNELVSNWLHIGANAFYNFIARNTMSFVGGGGNFNNAGNNAYGPFVTCNNTDLAANAATSHPQANLVY